MYYFKVSFNEKCFLFNYIKLKAHASKRFIRDNGITHSSFFFGILYKLQMKNETQVTIILKVNDATTPTFIKSSK